ncbi:MAG: hypothetical protein K6G10_06905 [Butyrivibrio sp.]|nr:hypothetical protein [Butyrivibrio sp.]
MAEYAMDYSKDNSEVIAMQEKYKTGEITGDEWAMFILNFLYNLVSYCIKENHLTAYAEYDDLHQLAALAVLKVLPLYDAKKATPATYFLPYIIEGMRGNKKDGIKGAQKGEGTTEYYTKIARKLNTAARELGKASYSDFMGHPEILAQYTGESLETVKKAMKYDSTITNSFEAVSENHNLGGTGADPVTIVLQKELHDNVHGAMQDNLTSFDMFLAQETFMSGEPVSTTTIVRKLTKMTPAERRESFGDDEVATKTKFNGIYIERRKSRIRLVLGNDSRIRNYAPVREQIVKECDNSTQAADEDLFNAFNNGDFDEAS